MTAEGVLFVNEDLRFHVEKLIKSGKKSFQFLKGKSWYLDGYEFSHIYDLREFPNEVIIPVISYKTEKEIAKISAKTKIKKYKGMYGWDIETEWDEKSIKIIKDKHNNMIFMLRNDGVLVEVDKCDVKNLKKKGYKLMNKISRKSDLLNLLNSLFTEEEVKMLEGMSEEERIKYVHKKIEDMGIGITESMMPAMKNFLLSDELRKKKGKKIFRNSVKISTYMKSRRYNRKLYSRLIQKLNNIVSEYEEKFPGLRMEISMSAKYQTPYIKITTDEKNYDRMGEIESDIFDALDYVGFTFDDTEEKLNSYYINFSDEY